MPVVFASAAAIVVGGAFTWSAVAKLVTFARWSQALERYRLPGRRSLALSVPAVEAVVAVLLLSGTTRLGGAAALGLLGAFSLVVLRARALQGERLPCGCFGGTGARDYRMMLARNALLGLAAGVVLAPGRDIGLLEGVHAPERGDAVPVALLLVSVALVTWLALTAARTLRGDR